MRPSNNLENKTLSDNILKSSASMYESSDSQFFRNTTAIQSRPDAFDESRFVMTFLTILGVTEILCSSRLVLERKTGKEKPKSSRFEFLEKILANNFALSHAEDNTSGPSIASIASELSFRYRKFSLLVQTKIVISIIYGSSTSS